MTETIDDFSSYEIDPEQYQIIQMIGVGHFGSAYLAQNINTGEYFALKQIPCQMLSPVQQEYLNREIKIMAQVSHPSLLSLRGYSTPFNSTKLNDNIATIIMDFMENGSLFNVLELARTNQDMPYWNPTTKNKMLIGIASGMKYLHDMKIIHRDLKPENVLLDENFEPKITDFGLSKAVDKFGHTKSQRNTPNIGTPLYMPPEIFSNKPYSFKVDVFAFGVMSYEIITGLVLYPEVTSPVELGIKICNGERLTIPDSVSPDFKNLISRCWAQDPRQRPTFEEIYTFLIHPNTYLKGAELDYLNAYKKKMREADFNSKLDPTIKWTAIENQLISQNNQMKELQNSLEELMANSMKNNEVLKGNILTVKSERNFIEQELKNSIQKNNELMQSITQQHQQIKAELIQLNQQIKVNSQPDNTIFQASEKTIGKIKQERHKLSMAEYESIKICEFQSPPSLFPKFYSPSPAGNRPSSLQLRFPIQFDNIHPNSLTSDQSNKLANGQDNSNNSFDDFENDDNDEFYDDFGNLDNLDDFDNIDNEENSFYNCFDKSTDTFFDPNDDQNAKRSKKKKDKQRALEERNCAPTPRKRFHFPRRGPKIMTSVEVTA